uniref:Reverse transcriptase n=1 Tax=Rhabditophanes sp. KR3021 TaxID=114890 RepID=A0AC35UI22_9BILA
MIARILIDTGAGISMVSKDFCTRHQITFTPTNQVVANDFGNHPITSLGRTTLELLIGENKINIYPFILLQLDYDILLGADTLTELDKNGLATSFKLFTKYIKIGCTKFPLIGHTRNPLGGKNRGPNQMELIQMLKGLQLTPHEIEQEQAYWETELDTLNLEVPEELTEEYLYWESKSPTDDSKDMTQISWNNCALTEKWRICMETMLVTHDSAFTQFPEDIGRYNGPHEHCINLIENHGRLPRTKVPRYSAAKQDSAKKHIDKMLRQDVIEKCTSDCASRYIIVVKKDGDDRIVVDFRAINNITVPEITSIPLIEDIIDRAGGKKFFTLMDLVSGFHQIPIRESDRYLTAFNTPWGLYRYKYTPMGLTGAPGTFSKIMTTMFEDLRDSTLVYIDDIIVMSDSEEQHIKDVDIALSRLEEYGMKVRLDKCTFGADRVKYLGFIISNKGIEPDPDKIIAIKNLAPPKDIKAVRGFLGVTNFFGRFIQNLAVTTEPLRKLLLKDKEFVWNDTCQLAFDTLKEKLVQAPILSTPQKDGKFQIYTDASYSGLGAALLQEQPEPKVLAYISRSLNKHEKNYPPIHLEAMALVWALDKWQHYIMGHETEAFTDHQPLISLFKSKELQGKLARYQARLMQYRVKLMYKPGVQNVLADYLSRYGYHQNPKVLTIAFDKLPWQINQTRYSEEEHQHLAKLAKGKKTTFIDGNFYHLDEDRNVRGIIPPEQEKLKWITAFHNHPLFGGHFGIAKIHQKLTNTFHCAGLKNLYKKIMAECMKCQEHKTIPSTLLKHSLQRQMCGAQPLARVHMDLLQPTRKTTKGHVAMLVAIDSTSRFIMLAPLQDMKTETIIEKFLSDIIFKYGKPAHVTTDNGKCFSSSEFQSITKILEIKHHFTTPNHHRSNGLVERMNRVLNEGIRIYAKHSEWDEACLAIAYCYNSSIHHETGFSPSYLMFGRENNFSISAEHPFIISDYTDAQDKWKQMIITLQNIWTTVSLKAEEKAELSEDKSNRLSSQVQKGDLVLRKYIAHKRESDGIWRGPFKVIQTDAHQRALIKKVNGRIRPAWVHFSQLKKYTLSM